MRHFIERACGVNWLWWCENYLGHKCERVLLTSEKNCLLSNGTHWILFLINPSRLAVYVIFSWFCQFPLSNISYQLWHNDEINFLVRHSSFCMKSLKMSFESSPPNCTGIYFVHKMKMFFTIFLSSLYLLVIFLFFVHQCLMRKILFLYWLFYGSNPLGIDVRWATKKRVMASERLLLLFRLLVRWRERGERWSNFKKYMVIWWKVMTWGLSLT